ncbi:MAG: hypothetical protein RBT36_05535 [Desulfobulbus sp.]|jgi:hypothetical protein|nr:hypothetical protein [Desulfobulbus sp.]
MTKNTNFNEEHCPHAVVCDRCGSSIYLEKVYLSPAGTLCGRCMFRLWFVRLFAGRS